MRTAVLAFVLAACGRIGFDAPPPAGDGHASGDAAAGDAATTGAVGERWFTTFGTQRYLLASGAQGEAIAAADYTSSIDIGGQTFTALGPFQSAIVARFSRTGTMLWHTLLDSTGFCDMRALLMLDDSVLAAGISIGSTMPMYGPCAIMTNHEDPIGLLLDPHGTAAPNFHYIETTSNAQAWDLARLADGSLAVSGVYGSDLKIGAVALPNTPVFQTDNAFYARVPAGAGDPLWAAAVVSNTMSYAGPVSAGGTDTCLVGGYSSAATFLGQPLGFHGGAGDAFVARVDGTGAVRFIREIGSPGDERNDNYSVLATPDGGCLVSVDAGGDLVIDAMSLPASAGAGVLLRFDATGQLVRGSRVPGALELAVANGHVFGALDISAPAFGYTPAGADVVIVELDANDGLSLVGAVGGAGDQNRGVFGALAAIAPDALAIAVFSTGALTFAGQTADSGATQVHALAVLGVAP